MTEVAVYLGDVVVVAPLANAYPLFSVLLSFLFIQQAERITLKVAAGAAIMAAGVGLVMLSGPLSARLGL